jgi:hypothetical protein
MRGGVANVLSVSTECLATWTHGRDVNIVSFSILDTRQNGAISDAKEGN